MVRASISSLKAHRSSSEPPPRPTMITSTPPSAFSSRMPWATSPAAPSPCTRAGASTMWTSPKRRPMIAQHVAQGGPAGRGHDADLARKARQRALAARVEEPLGLQPLLELLEGQLQGAEPARLEQLDHQLVLARAARRPRRRRRP